MFQAVLFDLDGTLVDTAPDFARVLNQVRAEEQLPPLAYAQIREQVSNGARALVRLGFGLDEGEPDQCRLLNRLLALYAEGLAVESRLFDGLAPALETLEARGIPWGVVTNKPALYTFPLLAGLGLLDRCKTVICPDHVTHKKPHPEPLFKACGDVSALPARSVYVGDHVRDIESGRNAGCLTVAAGWGYLMPGESASDWQADHEFSSTSDFSEWLMQTLSP